MKKIITALANPILNENLKKEKDFEILTKDIQYQEGIFEIIEEKNEIDYLILSEILPGENNIEKLIEKIKEKNIKIKIIIIIESKKEELENILYKKGILKIYYNNEVEINEIISFIKNENKKIENDNEEIKKELNKLKEILIKNNIYYEIDEENNSIKNEKSNKIKKNKTENNNKIKLTKNKKYNIEINNKKIISIVGTGGVGKSIVTLNLAKILKEKQNKILIIDFDILNNSLHTILGVNKYPQKIKEKLQKNNLIQNKINIKELIIKINKKVDLISGINLLFDSKYKISNEKIKFILEELKEYYDTIIIDTSSECFFDYTKNILKNSNNILFLLEANLLELKKANNLLNIYTEEWNIAKEKFNLIINKYNENSVDDLIINNIFSKYKILGKIKMSKKYNILINKNYKQNIFQNNIKKEYEKITDKIIKLNNRKRKLILENIINKIKYNLIQKNNLVQK